MVDKVWDDDGPTFVYETKEELRAFVEMRSEGLLDHFKRMRSTFLHQDCDLLKKKMIRKDFVRDSRSPIPKNGDSSRVMSANRSKDTGPELTLRKELWRIGVRGYRLHCNDIPGRPDVAFRQSRLAVFVNGCYWHRCPYCKLPLPKSNANFWKEKFRVNTNRDRKKSKQLRKLGWKVVTIWECKVNDKVKLKRIIMRIKSAQTDFKTKSRRHPSQPKGDRMVIT